MAPNGAPYEPCSIPATPSLETSAARIPALSAERTEQTSTPVAVRIASVRHSDDNLPWTVSSLNSILDLELDGAKVDNQPLPPIIFPDDALPFPINEDLINRLSNVYADHSWTQSLDYTETSYADWFNSIGDALEALTKVGRVRKWSADSCTAPLPGATTKRKPDIMLVDCEPGSPDTQKQWSSIRAIAEVTAENRFPQRMRITIQQKSFLAFYTQPDRRFVLSLSFSRDRFFFTACDRAGLVNSFVYNIHQDALVLLRVLVGLMFCPERQIGYDDSMYRAPDGNIITITVNGQEYAVVRKIFSSETVRGRATQCWLVRRDRQTYILKDSWCIRSRASESDMLKRLDGVQHVPHLYDSEDLNLGTELDSTAARRVGISEPEERVHRRLVMGPVGECLYAFASKKELVQAFIDAVTGACIQCFSITYMSLPYCSFFCSTSGGLRYKRDLAQGYQHQQYNAIQSGPSVYLCTYNSASPWLVDRL
jgi:hypothetical protein